MSSDMIQTSETLHRIPPAAVFLTVLHHNRVPRVYSAQAPFNTTESARSRRRDDGGMQVTSGVTLRRRLGRHALPLVLALGAVAALAGEAVHAQNIDAGKSVTRMFADNCASCHHSARGLAKGRFRLTLYLFLQQHYASNSSSAWTLASYLESVEGPQRRPPRAGAAKPSAAAAASRFSLRPPMPVPDR
jgi:hypothetical protein